MTRPIAFLVIVMMVGRWLMPMPLQAEDIARLQSGVVKITAKLPEGSQRVGTGFIVRLDEDAAYIVTAAHVVSGDPHPQVEFFTKRNAPVSAEVFPGAEGGDEVRGLALLMVKGKENIPSDLVALPLASNIRLSGGEDIILIGFPRGVGPWAVIKGNISSRQGRDIYFSPTVGEGNSGGPIIQNGKVVGLVGAGGQLIGQGVTVRSIEDYIEGFGIQENPVSGTVEEAQETVPPSVAKLSPTPRLPIEPETSEAAMEREITGKDGALMVLIPAGEFWMGSPEGEGYKDEHPRHRVYVDAFYIDKFEVTRGKYDEFLRSTNMYIHGPWDQLDPKLRGLNLPVGVHWNEAENYCHWAGKRLPTEAEWEKAARGTDGRIYPWGNEKPTSRLANFGQKLGEVKEPLTPVDSHEAGLSPYGIYNMAGNIREWVSDWYDGNYYMLQVTTNPKGPAKGQQKVLRGGSYFDSSASLRAAQRFRMDPAMLGIAAGFRCARDSQQ